MRGIPVHDRRALLPRHGCGAVLDHILHSRIDGYRPVLARREPLYGEGALEIPDHTHVRHENSRRFPQAPLRVPRALARPFRRTLPGGVRPEPRARLVLLQARPRERDDLMAILLPDDEAAPQRFVAAPDLRGNGIPLRAHRPGDAPALYRRYRSGPLRRDRTVYRHLDVHADPHNRVALPIPNTRDG